MRLLLAAVVGYCIGSVSSAVLVGRAAGGIDVRKYGSGTAGGANVGRVLGVKYGMLVACCDVAKGMAAAVVGRAIGGAPGQMASGAAAVIGHILPIWFGFAGGKAIATFFGSCVLTAPAAVLPASALWLTLYLVSRSVAQASAIASACLPLIGWVCRLPWRQILYLGVMGAAICLRHIPDARTPGQGRRRGRPGRPTRPQARGLMVIAVGVGLCLATLPAVADSGESIRVRVGLVGLAVPVALGSNSSQARLRVAGSLEMPVAMFQPDEGGRIVCVSPDGTRTSLEGPVAVEIASPGQGAARPLIWVGQPGYVYRGQFELACAAKSGEMHVINILDLEDYVAGVVPYEIGAGAPFEALKAQAVVARTEAVALGGRHDEEPFDTCSSTHCQVYRGAAAELDRPDVRRAVDSTRGEALFYNGRPAPGAKYHACCGGITESAGALWRFDVPYMVGVGCSLPTPESSSRGAATAAAIRDEQALRAVIEAPNPGDFCYGSNGYRWRVEYTAGQLAAVLAPVIGRLEQPESRVIRVAVIERTPRGSAVRVRVTTTEGEYEIVGEYAIRSALGGTVTIKSGVFVVDTEGDPPSTFVFSGAGYGHGVGMCQYGARGMARAGYDYRAILEHYYPGTTVEQILRPVGN
ncbi:MAG: glycerol-3-phosphate acyltransferase [Firmicutes bacterium]|nr:glycerol-3-phosphate acyltransferase [Bacillota bacterium]